MLEQQLTERFRAVVADEPPLRLAPDELVDRLLRRRRRRLGVATAVGVVMVATIAVGGAALGGPATGGAALGGAATGPQRTASAPPSPTAVTAPAHVTIAATVPAGSYDLVAEQRKQASARSVSDFLVDAVPTDRGTLEIRRDGDVLFHADLAKLDAYVFRPREPVVLKPGQRVLVAVTCERTLSRTGTCRVDVTFPVLVVAR